MGMACGNSRLDLSLSLRPAMQSRSSGCSMPLELDGIVLERHRVAVFEQRAHEVVGARIVGRLDEELAALRRFANFAVLDARSRRL